MSVTSTSEHGLPSIVLVVGANGSTAGMVVSELRRLGGVTVRGMTRSERGGPDARRNGADEVVIADLTDPGSLRRALDGVGGVFLVTPAMADRETEMGMAMVEAASESGVDRFVFSSALHPSLPLSNHRNKAPIEGALAESNMAFTILQPAMFMHNLAGSFRSAVQSGTLEMPWSPTSELCYVDYREVAEIAARAFNDDTFQRSTLELCSPGEVSMHDVARIMSDVAQRPIEARRMPTSAKTPESLRLMFDHYDEHGFRGGNSLVMSAALGRPPMTIRTYIEQLATPKAQ